MNPKKAYWTSVDGDLLLYMTFNDSAVANFEYPWVEDNILYEDPLKLSGTKNVRYPMVRILSY